MFDRFVFLDRHVPLFNSSSLIFKNLLRFCDKLTFSLVHQKLLFNQVLGTFSSCKFSTINKKGYCSHLLSALLSWTEVLGRLCQKKSTFSLSRDLSLGKKPYWN